jgi:hypothetical protein
MSVSANTLFHFTVKQRLEDILHGGFHASYSKEDISIVTPLESNLQEVYIPMVCFCDLPFHQILPHLDFYGHYGIGLRKESWGMKFGICPVHYIPDASMSSFTINSLASNIVALNKSSHLPEYTNNLFEVYKLIKPFKGKVINRVKGVVSNSGRKTNRIFYDEREWRFCPPKFPIIPCNEAGEKTYVTANLALKRDFVKLTFKPEDVKYIIVQTEREIMDFANIIEKNPKLKSKSRLLISKLISVEQIKADF